MMKRFVALALMAFSLASCGDRFPDYHYRMTVYVDGQSFSSVRAVEQEEVTSIVDSSGRTVKRSLRGEAVIIDHPNGRTYYALLGKPNDPDYATLIAGAALRDHVRREPQSEVDAEIARRQASEPQRDSDAWLDDMAGRSRALTEVEGPRDLPRQLPARSGRPPYEAWPMFVTFTNPANPRTVREVSPESIGVERITIEITDEDVTEGIEERLGWLANHRGSLVRRARDQFVDEMVPAERLGPSDFSQGIIE